MKYRLKRVVESYITVEAPSLEHAIAIATGLEPDDEFVDNLQCVEVVDD